MAARLTPAAADDHADIAAADPERALAIAYAPAVARPALAALWRIDLRLAEIAAKARDPGLAALRTVWWRDALARLDTVPAPPEPLLCAAATLLLPAGVSGAAVSAIAEGWLAAGEGDDAEGLAEHAAARGGGMFATAAVLLGAEDPRVAAAGAGWALADLARGGRDPARLLALAKAHLDGLGGGRWPVALRPLGMLALLARGDARRGRVGRQGAPGRVLRALGHRATGY